MFKWSCNLPHSQVDHCYENGMLAGVDAIEAFADEQAGPVDRAIATTSVDVATKCVKHNHKRPSTDEVCVLSYCNTCVTHYLAYFSWILHVPAGDQALG